MDISVIDPEVIVDALERAEVENGIVKMSNQFRDIVVNLLKEHEAVKPILIREGRNKHYNDYVCPRCDNEVVYEQNYCSECGVQFLWEGR